MANGRDERGVLEGEDCKGWICTRLKLMDEYGWVGTGCGFFSFSGVLVTTLMTVMMNR